MPNWCGTSRHQQRIEQHKQALKRRRARLVPVDPKELARHAGHVLQAEGEPPGNVSLVCTHCGSIVMDYHQTLRLQREREALYEALSALLESEASMGSGDAPVWTRARELCRRLQGRETS
jgi:hypothetical protein